MDFDRWRSEYDRMSFQQQQDFYNEAFKVYPVQASFNLEKALEFFARTAGGNVTEIGGWDGQLAGECLARVPNLWSWTNLEISTDAAASHKISGPRYSVPPMTDFAWNGETLITGEIFLATHFIEHIKMRDLTLLMQGVSTDWVYFESPLLFPGWRWGGNDDNHILEAEWADVHKMMQSLGYGLSHFEMDDRFRQTGYATYRL